MTNQVKNVNQKRSSKKSNTVHVDLSALPLLSLQEVAQHKTGPTLPTPSTGKKTPAAALGKAPSEKGMCDLDRQR